MTELANDKARREQQRDDVKANVESDVNAAIAQHAAEHPADARDIGRVAGEFRDHAVTEIADTEREVGRARTVARVSQVIGYAFFLVYALLAIRFVLSLIAARSSVGFVQFIVSITNPLYAPFKNIVASPRTDDGNVLLYPVLIAIVAYALLHFAIKRLLLLVAVRKTEI